MVSRKPILTKAILWTAIFLGIFLATITIIDFFSGNSDVFAIFSRLNVSTIVILLLLSLVNYFCRVFRWHVTSRYLQLNISFKDTLLIYFSGFSMTATPARVGEAIRLWSIESCYGYAYEKLAPLLIIDRISDVNAVLLLCIFGLGSLGGYYWATVLATLFFLLLLLLFIKPGFLLSLIRMSYAVIGRWPRLFVKVSQAVNYSANVMRSRCYAFALILALFGWLAECIAFHYLLHDFGLLISFRQAIFIFTFAMLVGGITMLPGGLGGTEVTMFGLLVVLGVSADTATAATFIIRLTTFWFAIGLGFISLPWLLLMVKKRGKR